MPSGFVKDANNVAFAGISAGALVFTVVDTVAPSVVSYRPADQATGVAANSDVILEFDSAVAKGTGNVVLQATDDAAVAVTLAVGGSGVRVFGRYVVIDPVASLDAGLTGRTYKVLLASGVLTDTATTPNAFAGLSGTAYTFTVVSTVAPTVVTFLPANGATGVSVADPVVLTFSEPVTLTAGMFFVLTPSVSGPVLEIDAGDATQVVLSAGDTVVTITPTAELSAAVSGQTYRLEMATGVVRDTDVPSNAFAGLFSAMYTFTVADVAAPVLVSQVPAAGATGVSKAANIVLTFNEPMAAGTGDIVLTPASVGGTAVTLAADGARVTVSGTTVTIDPAADLAPTRTTEETCYTVTVAAGALTDAAGNAWAGLAGSAYTCLYT